MNICIFQMLSRNDNGFNKDIGEAAYAYGDALICMHCLKRIAFLYAYSVHLAERELETFKKEQGMNYEKVAEEVITF